MMFAERKSIRKYKPDPISEEDLRTILEAGRVAPSAKNRQPWEFIVFTGTPKDEVLAEIITDDMSAYDKAHAIYVWVQGNIGYSESDDSGDWLKGAYDGLKNRHGDCYNYFAVSKALLTRAGIPNEDIEIIPTATRHHYWNVIDCGEGWRHFDTTPRLDKSFKGFYLTDEELMTYSDAHYHSHNYDREIYTYFNDNQEQ